ncbi:14697_t:CDS:2 [Funneliformis mosseae]|uniref:14697_t:CDS:1 n=1 Tax=Funneliformis mosseae TaxID=27381 RepID=A0A9N9FIA2_FUNMO|nr:14697_t:CDS:2 [Funneliformis mosseae]
MGDYANSKKFFDWTQGDTKSYFRHEHRQFLERLEEHATRIGYSYAILSKRFDCFWLKGYLLLLRFINIS